MKRSKIDSAMSKKVLVRLDGFGVFETLEDASRALGVTPESVSRAVRDARKVNGVSLKWADRVYAVCEKGGDWKVVVLNSRNSAYLPVSQVGDKVPVRNVVKKKDITASWYGMEFAGGDGEK